MKSLWMIAGSLSFAVMGACIKLAAEMGIPISTLTFYRCLITIIPFYLFLRWRRVPIATPHWKAHLSRSACGTAALACYFTAISLLPLATAVTVNYTSPLFVALFVMILTKSPVRVTTLGALVVGLVGVALLLRPSFRPEYYLGTALAFASAVLAAGSFMSLRRLGELGEASWRTVFYFTLFASIMTFPWFLANDPLRPLAGQEALLILAVGMSATVGQLLVTIAYQQGEALISASLGYTQVIFSAALGVWIWSDTILPEAWIGMLAIIASGILTTRFQYQPVRLGGKPEINP